MAVNKPMSGWSRAQGPLAEGTFAGYLPAFRQVDASSVPTGDLSEDEDEEQEGGRGQIAEG